MPRSPCNTGLGKEAARHYARLGAGQIILAVRDLDKGHDAKHDIEHTTQCSNGVIQVWRLDMASYASVRSFTTRVHKELDRVDIVLANAGLASAKHAVAEGNELLFTVNCLSTLLLSGLIVPKLKDTAARFNVRPVICITGSVAHNFTQFSEKTVPLGGIFDALNQRASADESQAAREDLYSISKLLPVFAVRAIAEHCPSSKFPVTINIADPGLCWSHLARDFSGGIGAWVFMSFLARSTEVGSRPGGKELQERVWAEIVEKLEAIRPGVTSNFTTIKAVPIAVE
ncbi:hypothetical protein S40293_07822 [Stachybotrys chartarum IBT 40293]|nr:hypothetical protein S40293_07822 [Stachybotrys chartarum IBT 40293]